MLRTRKTETTHENETSSCIYKMNTVTNSNYLHF